MVAATAQKKNGTGVTFFKQFHQAGAGSGGFLLKGAALALAPLGGGDFGARFSRNNDHSRPAVIVVSAGNSLIAITYRNGASVAENCVLSHLIARGFEVYEELAAIELGRFDLIRHAREWRRSRQRFSGESPAPTLCPGRRCRVFHDHCAACRVASLPRLFWETR